MKRAITGIVAASLTLGTMAPAAFAATTASAPSYFGSKIAVGTYSSNVQALKVQDAGNTTALFPFYYIQAGLQSIGYTVKWDGVAKRLDITTPAGVTLDTTNLNPGVGDAGIYINGTLVQRAPFSVANDKGGNNKPTSFMAAYYLNQALAHVGFTNTYDGAGSGWTLTAPATKPVVTGASAPNLRQVLVTFNRPVDNVTAADITNYSVLVGGVNKATTVGNAAIQADGKSVLLTLDTAALLPNNGTAEVTVSGVKDVTGQVAPDFDQTVSVSDVSAPTVTGVTVTGPSTFQVTFSEPVKSAGSNFIPDFSVDNGNYVVLSANANGSGTVVTVTTGAPLTSGSHTVSISSGTTDLQDYASLPLAATSKTFSVAPVTSLPTASIQSSSQTKVVVKFSQPVANLNAATLYAVYNNGTYGDAVTATGDSNGTTYTSGATTYYDTWNLTFAAPLPAGSVPIFVTNNTSTPIADAWGNKYADTTWYASVATDTTKPVVTSATIAPNSAQSAHVLTVNFSEDVQKVGGGTPDSSTIIVTDSDGNVVPFAVSPTYDATKDTYTATSAALIAGDTYTITVKNLEDKSPNMNTLDTYTTKVTVPNLIPPTASVSYVDAGKKLEVTYSTAMNTSDIGNKANYAVTDFGSTPDPVSSVQVIDNKHVVLTLSNSMATGKPSVAIQNVSDTNGNKIASFGAYTVSAGTTLADAGAAISSVKAISPSEVQVTFDRLLTGFSATGYTFVHQTDGSASTEAVGYLEKVATDSNGNSVVTFHLNTALSADAKDASPDGISLVITQANTTAVDGLGVKAATTVPTNASADVTDVADAIAPTVSAVTWNSASQITVTFTEPLAAATFAAATANGFTTSAGAVATAVPSGNTVVLTAASGVTFVKGSTTVSYNSVAGVTDGASNALASFSGQVAN